MLKLHQHPEVYLPAVVFQPHHEVLLLSEFLQVSLIYFFPLYVRSNFVFVNCPLAFLGTT